MRLHDLKPAPGSRRPRKRIGRGISAGQGKTSGRGQKGQFARTPGLRVGFEGGQMPLAQRLPKLRGFHNRFKKDYAVVNVSKLSRFEPDSVVDPDVLRAAGLVGNARDGVKVLGAGRLRVKLTLRVHRVSAGARTAVEKAGGSVELLEAPPEATAAENVGTGVAEVTPGSDTESADTASTAAEDGDA
jgi:large subunit ribosomal protein L15